MDLKQLKYFLAVAEHLNFSRAAETLYISQPTLSYQIAELEKELGEELFVRDRRGIFLTSAGTALIEPSREILKSASELPGLVRQSALQSGEKGMLRIGFDNTEDHYEVIGIAQAIASFSEANPKVTLDFMQATFPQCADSVIFGDLDLAFLILRHGENLPPTLTAKPVYQDRLVLVVRADVEAETCGDVIRTKELIHVSDKPRGQSRIQKCLVRMGLTPKTYTVDSVAASFALTLTGRATMPLPAHYFRQHKYENLREIPIPDDAAVLSYMAVWNKTSDNPVLHHFLRTI